MKSRHHDEAMSELYRSDPALALEVINDILAEGDQAEFWAKAQRRPRLISFTPRSAG